MKKRSFQQKKIIELRRKFLLDIVNKINNNKKNNLVKKIKHLHPLNGIVVLERISKKIEEKNFSSAKHDLLTFSTLRESYKLEERTAELVLRLGGRIIIPGEKSIKKDEIVLLHNILFHSDLNLVSPGVFANSLTIFFNFHYSVGDFRFLEEKLELIRRKIENHSHLRKSSFISTVYLFNAFAFIGLRNIDLAIINSEKAKQSSIKGYNNELTATIILTISYLHAKQYEKASEVFNDLDQLTQTNVLHANLEIWEVLKEYIGFIERRILKLEENKISSKSKIHLITHPYNDKLGYNVSIQLIKLVSLIERREFDPSSFLLKSLNSYVKRLRRQNPIILKRSATFIKQAQKLVKYNFQKSLLKKEKSRFLIELSKHSLVFQHEIIPYEHLWEMIIEMLPEKPVYV